MSNFDFPGNIAFRRSLGQSIRVVHSEIQTTRPEAIMNSSRHRIRSRTLGKTARQGLDWAPRVLLAIGLLLLASSSLRAQGAAVIQPSVIGGAGVQQEGDYGAFFATIGEPLNYEPDTVGVVDESTWIGFIITVNTDPALGIEETARPVISGSTGISEMYPNPFNAETRIVLQLQTPGMVKLTVYDQVGREVLRLVDGNRAAGELTIDWKPEDLSSGAYLLELEVDGVRYPARLVQYYR
jgi:hypothetical protein